MKNLSEKLIESSGQKYIITIHAQERLYERYGDDADIEEIIKTSVPFGAQKGTENSLLLSKDNKLVLATVKDGRYIVVKTVLTIKQAISNMEKIRLVDEKTLSQLYELVKTSLVEEVEEEEPQESYALKCLAQEHYRKGHDKKTRNKILRSLG